MNKLSFVIRKLEFPEDVIRIQKVMQSYGYDLTIKEAEELWEKRSLNFDAGWLALPEEDIDLYNDIINFLENIDAL